MMRFCAVGLMVIPVLLASAQTTPAKEGPAGVEQWTSTSITEMEKTLSSKSASDAHHAASEKLADFQNETFMMAHREADGQSEWHETQTDVFIVESGSATLIVGGTLVGEQTTSPHEKRGTSIQGGVRKMLAAGDIIRIPAGTPHQLLLDGSHEFNYFVIKIKGY